MSGRLREPSGDAQRRHARSRTRARDGDDETHKNLTIERFAPVLLEGAGGEGGLVTFEKSDKELEVGGDVPLLEAGEECGVVMPSGCRMGICNTCSCRKTSGAVRNVLTGETSAKEDELIRICVSVPVGDVEIAL